MAFPFSSRNGKRSSSSRSASARAKVKSKLRRATRAAMESLESRQYLSTVALYNFDETSGTSAADASGNGLTATLRSGSAFTQGRNVGGMSANGSTNAGASVSDHSALNPTSEITLSAWVKASDWSGNRRIISKGATDNQYRLLADSNALKFDLAGVGNVTASLPSTGVWHHVAGTYDGSLMKLYVDGTQVASSSQSGSISTTTDPLMIGAKSAGDGTSGNFFNGTIDQARIDDNALSASEVASLASGNLPAGWTSLDVGSPSPAGFASYDASTNGGTYTVGGGGSDIWNTPDQFQYAYRTLSGDGTIIARVASIQNTNGSAKIGVMIRDGSSGSSNFVDVVVTPSNGTLMQWRNTTGGPSSAGGSSGAWVKLVRSGNTFTGYRSTDGTNWNQISSTTMAMSTDVAIGLVNTSHNNGTLNTSTFDNVSVTGAESSVPAAPTGLIAAAASNNQINLSWADNSGNEAGFIVDRATNSSFTSNLTSTTVAGNTNVFMATGLNGSTTYYFRVRATNISGDSANTSTASTTTTSSPTSSVPDGWSTTDVGSPSPAGSTQFNSTSGTWVLSGSGNDIWNTPDQFHYAYQSMSGNGTIIARVTGIQNTNNSAIAGVMIRESTASNSAFVDMIVTPNNGGSMNWRGSGGGPNSVSTSGAPPRWVKLVRNGNTFVGSVSTDGVNWTQVSSQTVSMGTNVTIGLVECSRSGGTLGTSTFDNVGVYVAPTVAAAASANPATVTTTTTDLSVLGADNNGESVLTYTWAITAKPGGASDPAFSANGTNAAKNATATFSKVGSYTFEVTIANPAGYSTTSSVSVTVNSSLASVAVNPTTASVAAGNTQQFSATGYDQFGIALASQPTFTWSIDSGGIGSVSSGGLYTAPVGTTGSASVRATSGAFSDAVAVTVAPSQFAPSAPSGLSAAAVSTSQVNLAWTDTSNSEDGFKIERSVDGGAYALLATIATPNTSSYSDTALADGTSYAYRVYAYNDNGGSALSNTSSAVTPLPVPSGLAVTSATASTIELSWTDNADNATGFSIERYRLVGGVVTDLTTFTSSTTSYSDSGLADGSVYYYRVSATNSQSSSAKTAPLAGATGVLAPTDLTVSLGDNGHAGLAWAGNSVGAQAYMIERSASSSGGFTLIATLPGAVTSYTDKTAGGTSYYYRVRAFALVGGTMFNSAYSEISSARTAAVTDLAFGKPTTSFSDDGQNVAAGAFDGSPSTKWQSNAAGGGQWIYVDLGDAYNVSRVRLAWSANFPSTYTVQVSEDASNWSDVYSTSSGSGSVSDLSGLSGIGRYVRVYANAAFATPIGLYAFEVYGTSADQPPAPSNLAVTPLSSSVLGLSWTINSTGETGFKIERSTDGTNFTAVTSSIPAGVNRYEDTGRSAATTYYYRVTALGTGGNDSPASAIQNATTPAAASGKVWFVGSDSITQGSWQGIYGAQGDDIVGTTANVPSYATVTPTGHSTTVWSELTNDPRALATSSSTRTARAWSAADDFNVDLDINDGNIHQIALYLVDFDQQDRTTQVNVLDTTSGGVLATQTVSDFGDGKWLIFNVAGSVRLQFVNQAGPDAVLSGLLFDATVPSAPSNLQSRALSSSTIQLTWADNAASETGYTIERSVGNTSGFAPIASVESDVTGYLDVGLSPSTTYYYRVRASSDSVDSAYSSVVQAQISSAVPHAPTNLTLEGLATNEVVLSWTDNANNEAGFELQRFLPVGVGWVLDTTFGTGGTATTTESSYTDVDGVVDGTTYQYRVLAFNGSGNSSAITLNVTTPLPAPTGLVATDVTDTEVDLAWEESATTETSYTVLRSSNGGSSYAVVATINTADTTSYQDSGLSEDTTYLYQVRDSNSVATSPLAGPITVKTRLAAPSDLDITAYSTNSVSLAWTNHSGHQSGFTIQRATDAAFTQNLTTITPGNVTAYTDTTVSDNTHYYYRVQAIKAGNDSAFSAAVDVTTPAAPLAPSNLLAAAAAQDQINLSWKDNSSDETGFKIERATDSGFTQNVTPVATTAADVRTYIDSSVSASTAYYYRVRAVNANGDSANTGVATATTTAAPASVGLPEGWRSADVGGVSPAGSTSYNAATGLFFINGGASDIGTAPDQFHYAYRTLDGDGEIIARVAAQENSNGSAKTGVMIRQSTLDDAPFAAVVVTPETGTLLLYRSQGGAVQSVGGGSSPWVKLVRSGNSFSAYRSNDGTSWTQIGTAVTVNMLPDVAMGLVNVSHNAGALNTSQIDNVAATGAVSTIPSAPTGLMVTAASTSEINLSWADNSTDEAGFVIDRATDADFTQNLTTRTVVLNDRVFRDSGLTSGTAYYYRVRAFNVAGESAHSNAGSATPNAAPTSSLPAGWSHADIGSPSPAGSSNFNPANGVFTIVGSGADIHNVPDQFQYAYKTLDGDGEMIIRVNTEQPTEANAKAGIMIRESTAADAAFVSLILTPPNDDSNLGTLFQYRPDINSGQGPSSVLGQRAPWLKLVRTGNVFTAFASQDGVNWLQETTPVVVHMNHSVLIGLAVCSHLIGTANTSTFDQVDVSDPGTQVGIDGDASVNEGASYVLNLNDNGQTFTQWDINWGDGQTSTVSGKPDQVTHVYADGNADHTITATASNGSIVASANTFAVHVANVVPSVAIVGAPQNGIPGEEIELGSSVTDPGSLDTSSGFDYQWTLDHDGETLTGTAADFSFTPDEPGAYVITLRVSDKDGGTGVATKTIFVHGPDVTLHEIDSSQNVLVRDLQIVAGQTHIDVEYAGLSLSDNDGFINDAFEVALVDPATGRSLFAPIASHRDALINFSAGQSVAKVAEVSILNGTPYSGTIRIDTSSLPTGTAARLILRLTGQDLESGVPQRSSQVTIIGWGAGLPQEIDDATNATSADPLESSSRDPIDFAHFVDVTSRMTTAYGRTSFNQSSNTLFADLSASNTGGLDIGSTLLAVVRNISNSSVRVANPDGFTPDGMPFYNLANLLGDDRKLTAGESLSQVMAFFNPMRSRFTYDLEFRGQMNTAPKFSTQSVLTIAVGTPYVYDAIAADDENDAINYGLIANPASMSMDEIDLDGDSHADLARLS